VCINNSYALNIVEKYERFYGLCAPIFYRKFRPLRIDGIET